MEQMSLFDGSKKFVVDKPIRLISLFSGYDSQEFALKYLGVEYEHYKTCEWAVKSIQALKDAHYGEDNKDYSKELTQKEIIDYLYKKGISANYNEPMTYEQIKRLGEQKQRQIYNNIKATHNLVNVQQAKTSDLEIVDVDKYCYLMTYSFPCQDLSKAGLGKGMEKGSGTRSGMLWEVERILDECENLPQILLMENVPDVIGSKNIIHFAKWLEKLEKLGYHCYWQVLNAKDFGVPQNRERCFMISLLGDYYYEFPKKQKLEIRLKDILEKEVDEKYYLSSKAIEGSLKTNFASSKLENKIPKDGICPTIMARDYKDPKCVIEPRLMELTKNERQGNRVYNVDGFSVSLCANGGGLGAKTGLYMVNEPRICASRGRNPENPNSREKGLNTEQRIELGPEGISNTLTTVQKDNYVLEPNLKIQLCNELIASGKVKENDVIRHSYSKSRLDGQMKDIQQNNMCPTLDTRCDCLGIVVKQQEKYIDKKLAETIKNNNGETPEFVDLYNARPLKDGIAGTLSTSCGNDCGCGSFAYISNLRIRKLTPKECFRLMGVKDEDFDKVAQNQSNASLYHLAGDSIVVNVLMAIFSKLFKKE